MAFTQVWCGTNKLIYFALFFSVLFFLFRRKEQTTSVKIKKDNLGWIALISILTIGYCYTQMVAVNLGSVALVLALKRTSLFWTTIIGGKIFKDKYLLKRSFAALLIIIGAILIMGD
jgi:uncharacterized membrane protein